MYTKYYDIVIIGSGIAGLYSAYNIKKESPETSFVVLEKYKKQWIGGRTNNENFYGTTIVTGAGVGRKNKDTLLLKLLKDLDIHTTEYIKKNYYSKNIQPIDMEIIIDFLKKKLNQYRREKKPPITFKEFAQYYIGKHMYDQFILSSGYSDYENEDVFESLYYYGMEDNYENWKSVGIPWRTLILSLYHIIGSEHIKPSNDVISITKVKDEPCRFLIITEKGVRYLCNKVIIATTITGIRNLVPGAKDKDSLYNEIEGQPFLRLYGKFSKKSIPVMKEFIKGYTIVSGPLQKIIPINANKGIYMISYSDNENARYLKKYLENTSENREYFDNLLEKTLGIPKNTLQLVSIKDFYWPIGTHYYKPLDENKFKNREEFIYQAQHPEKGMLVVGEVVSRNQGWTEGALESVKAVLSKRWIHSEC